MELCCKQQESIYLVIMLGHHTFLDGMRVGIMPLRDGCTPLARVTWWALPQPQPGLLSWQRACEKAPGTGKRDPSRTMTRRAEEQTGPSPVPATAMPDGFHAPSLRTGGSLTPTKSTS